MDAALSHFGDLHIVVCCAGILRERMIFNMTEEEWDAVIAVHLKGHFTVMRAATRHMREKRYGRIITFTSTAGLEGSPGQPNYSAAKEGIVGLTRPTALAMAKYGVTVNCRRPRDLYIELPLVPFAQNAHCVQPVGKRGDREGPILLVLHEMISGIVTLS